MSTFRLDEGEELTAKHPANYFRGDDRPLGGRLYLTDRRAIFLPHRIDAFFGGQPTVLPYPDIRRVGVETPDDRDAGERNIPDRLRVEMVDGTAHLFLVSKLGTALERMEDALERGDASPDATGA